MPSRTGGIADRPAEPAPRISRSRKVSAWSFAVWPVAMRAAWFCFATRARKSYRTSRAPAWAVSPCSRQKAGTSICSTIDGKGEFLCQSRHELRFFRGFLPAKHMIQMSDMEREPYSADTA